MMPRRRPEEQRELSSWLPWAIIPALMPAFRIPVQRIAAEVASVTEPIPGRSLRMTQAILRKNLLLDAASQVA